MRKWVKKYNDLSLSLASSKWDFWLLFAFTFIDSSFVPLPAQTFFLLLLLMNRGKSLQYIIFGVLGTLTGAVAGFAAGHYAALSSHGEFTGVVKFLFTHIPGFSENVYNNMHGLFSKWGFWILFGTSFTPLPYGFAAISSGLFGINLPVFIVSTLLSQTLKFAVVAFITNRIGRDFRRIITTVLRPYVIPFLVCIVIFMLVD